MPPMLRRRFLGVQIYLQRNAARGGDGTNVSPAELKETQSELPHELYTMCRIMRRQSISRLVTQPAQVCPGENDLTTKGQACWARRVTGGFACLPACLPVQDCHEWAGSSAGQSAPGWEFSLVPFFSSFFFFFLPLLFPLSFPFLTKKTKKKRKILRPCCNYAVSLTQQFSDACGRKGSSRRGAMSGPGRTRSGPQYQVLARNKEM